MVLVPGMPDLRGRCGRGLSLTCCRRGLGDGGKERSNNGHAEDKVLEARCDWLRAKDSGLDWTRLDTLEKVYTL